MVGVSRMLFRGFAIDSVMFPENKVRAPVMVKSSSVMTLEYSHAIEHLNAQNLSLQYRV